MIRPDGVLAPEQAVPRTTKAGILSIDSQDSRNCDHSLFWTGQHIPWCR